MGGGDPAVAAIMIAAAVAWCVSARRGRTHTRIRGEPTVMTSESLADRLWETAAGAVPEEIWADGRLHLRAEAAGTLVLRWGSRARIEITPRRAADGQVTEVSWTGRTAAGGGLGGHSDLAGALEAVAHWAAGLADPLQASPEWIAALRLSLGMSQAEAAALCGVTAATWSAWEADRRAPRDPATVIRALEDAQDEAARMERITVEHLADRPGTSQIVISPDAWLSSETARRTGLPASTALAVVGRAAARLRADGRRVQIQQTN